MSDLGKNTSARERQLLDELQALGSRCREKDREIAQMRAQRDDALWESAACGSIAVGTPHWQDCVETSWAVMEVKKLRALVESMIKEKSAASLPS